MTSIEVFAENFVGRIHPLLSGIFQGAVVIILAGLAIKVGSSLLDRFFYIESQDAQKESKMKTVTGLLKSVLKYVIYFIAGISLLEIVGINTASLLTAAGVGGIAVGFGAQNLVKDVIAGFFIIFEDQYSVGDYVEVASVSGIVDEIGLRTTVIKAFSGEIHIIPNGEITLVTNHSRNNKRARVTINIGYEEDLARAIEVIKQACEKVKAERDDIVNGPNVLGISSFHPSHVEITIVAHTISMQQWAVERELRRAILESFRQHGIKIPYPKTIIQNADKQ